MRCPRCGLIHPPADLVCRRCEIDLATGQPAPRSFTPPPAETASADWRQLLKKFKTSGWGVKLRPGGVAASQPTTRETKKTTVRPTAPPVPPSIPGMVVAVSFGKKGRLTGLIKSLRRPQLRELTCIQCGGRMLISRARPYSRGGPAALLILAVVLAAVGFVFPLLFITAGLGVASGIVYLRLGRTFWKCAACGFVVPRAKVPSRSISPRETREGSMKFFARG